MLKYVLGVFTGLIIQTLIFVIMAIISLKRKNKRKEIEK